MEPYCETKEVETSENRSGPPREKVKIGQDQIEPCPWNTRFAREKPQSNCGNFLTKKGSIGFVPNRSDCGKQSRNRKSGIAGDTLTSKELSKKKKRTFLRSECLEKKGKRPQKARRIVKGRSKEIPPKKQGKGDRGSASQTIYPPPPPAKILRK